MASLANSTYMSPDTSFTGLWEDVQLYNSAIITVRSSADGSGTLLWANTKRNSYPSDKDVMYTDKFTYTSSGVMTIEKDHHARWYKLQFSHNTTPMYTDVSFNIQTLHRGTSTGLGITDGKGILDLVWLIYQIKRGLGFGQHMVA